MPSAFTGCEAQNISGAGAGSWNGFARGNFGSSYKILRFVMRLKLPSGCKSDADGGSGAVKPPPLSVDSPPRPTDFFGSPRLFIALYADTAPTPHRPPTATGGQIVDVIVNFGAAKIGSRQHLLKSRRDGR